MGYIINKEKCVGCRVCVQTCPGAIKMGKDGKAEIIDQEKLERCGGESICPMGAIGKISNKEEAKQREIPPTTPSPFSYGLPPGGRGLGRGRGFGRGMGRGMGRGPRDGRGGGRGGGSRKR